MSYNAAINDNIEAQVSENTLKSITNQTNVNAQTRAQISVGENPTFIETFEDYLYVANSGSPSDDVSGTLSVIDTHNNTVIDTITVGENPTFIETVGDYLYVANSGSPFDDFEGSVSVIDTHSNTVVDTITIEPFSTFNESPNFIEAVGPYLYTANVFSSIVSVIDTHNNTVIDTIDVGLFPIFIEADRDVLYVADLLSNTTSVLDTNNNTVIATIPVGKYPTALESFGDYIYVTNTGSNTVSVIDSDTNTVIDTIAVGEKPNRITRVGTYIYVINSGSPDRIVRIGSYLQVENFGSSGNALDGTVSVIDPRNNTVVDTITVGENPTFLETFEDYLYVANSGSNTTSVINPKINAVVKNIHVGEDPTFIETFGDALYVANTESNTVSLVDILTNEEVAGVKFDVKPFGAGQIICKELDAPINRFMYVSSGAKCIAKPTTGFEFSSWTQNLLQNTSVTINASTTSDWLVDPVAAFRDAFTDDPAATLTVNRFGNFTAYFKALPPAVPAEYIASLFTVVVTAIVGSLLIPSAISWLKSKKQTSRLNSFHQQMALVYSDGKLDESDTNQLNILNKNISDSYAAGKITNDQYIHLKNEVSTAYQKIFKKRIESITDPNTEAVNNIKNDIEDAYSDRKITELDYNLLNGKISRMFDKK